MGLCRVNLRLQYIHKLWVNGSPVTQNLPAMSQIDSPTTFQSGVIGNNVHGFRFRIAQLKFYDVALSSDQIEATKNVGVGNYLLIFLMKCFTEKKNPCF